MADPGAELADFAVCMMPFAVAIMMLAWWWFPNRTSPKYRSSGSIETNFESRAKELEMAGDLDGAMRILVNLWAEKGTTRAITLAHELSQRHPAGAFQVGCPVKPTSSHVVDVAAQLSAADCCPAEDAAFAGPEATCIPGAGSASNAAEVVSTTNDESVGTDYSEGSRGSSGKGCTSVVLPEKVREGDRGGAPVAQPVTVVPHVQGRNNSSRDRKREEKTVTIVVNERLEEQGEGRGIGDDLETSTPTSSVESAVSAATVETPATPWERGWQGPKGFKPPSTAAANSSTIFSTAVSDSPALSQLDIPAPVQTKGGNGLGGSAGEATKRRNFTVSQLNAFDGSHPPPKVRGGEIKASKARPIYIALRGEVYDASAGRNLYGPGGEYSEFAGHDVSRRVARGLKSSTDSATLDDLSLAGLDRFEEMTLRGWEDTFKARGYPILGRVVAPPPPRFFSRAELRAYDGRTAEQSNDERGRDGEGGGRGVAKDVSETVSSRQGPSSLLPAPMPMPADYAAQPIYIGVKDKVFDVSFGGSEFYLKGGPYECLAGRDASRVLAKMSMTSEDINGVLDYSCLTDREEQNLSDWVKKLGSGGKGYPVVGWIDIGV